MHRTITAAVMAGLVPAMDQSRRCLHYRDHRDSPLRGGPVMAEPAQDDRIDALSV
jgi:hypothetical protein